MSKEEGNIENGANGTKEQKKRHEEEEEAKIRSISNISINIERRG